MQRYISGFDYLRALLVILVVTWHAQGVSFIADINPHYQPFVNIFYYNICLLAVPSFFSISLFLFYRKQLLLPHLFPQKRLTNLIYLYGVWMIIGILFNLWFTQGQYILKLFEPKQLINIIVNGSRPELYFLFSLILLSYLAFVNSKYLFDKKHSIWIQIILFIISLSILPLISFTSMITHKAIFSSYWNPICFIPYIFSSSILVLINEEKKLDCISPLYSRKIQLILSLFLLFFGFSWWEWHTFNIPTAFNGELLPPYGRISLVIGAFLVCYYASLYERKPPLVVSTLSQESLGIYLIHGYILIFIELLDRKLMAEPILEIFFSAPLRVFFAILLSVLLSKLFKCFRVGRLLLNVHPQ